MLGGVIVEEKVYTYLLKLSLALILGNALFVMAALRESFVNPITVESMKFHMAVPYMLENILIATAAVTAFGILMTIKLRMNKEK